jgi:hypothetical protein
MRFILTHGSGGLRLWGYIGWWSLCLQSLKEIQGITWQETEAMCGCVWISPSCKVNRIQSQKMHCNLKHFPKAPPLNTKAILGFCFLIPHKWELNFDTWTFMGHTQTIPKPYIPSFLHILIWIPALKVLKITDKR